jgi:hypothetical protein
MLAIQEGEYTFPVYIEEDENNVEIFVGSSDRRRLPCVHISLYGSNAVLQDLVFLSHCSTNRLLLQGDGSLVIMLKSVLKWLCRKYPFVKYIEFMDKSYYNTQKGRIMLPEKMVLTEGKTWYMKHFGAEPHSPEAINAYKKYKTVYDTQVNVMKDKNSNAWTYENLQNIIDDFPVLNGKMISTTTWKIPKKTIQEYNVNPTESQMGGRIHHQLSIKQLYLRHKTYDFPWRIYVSRKQ